MIIWTDAYPETSFSLFNLPHLVSLAVIFVVSFLIIVFRSFWERKRVRFVVRWLLAFVLAANLFFLYFWTYLFSYFDIRYDLPLELCSITTILTIVMLAVPVKPLFEINYFLAVAGGIPALLTPLLYRYNFPHILFIQFFIDHGLLVICPLFIGLAYRFSLTKASIFKALAAVNIIGVFVLIVNIVTGANYMFLMRKPGASTLFDYLGPWPWYIVVCEVIALAVFGLLYLLYKAVTANWKSQTDEHH